jgi:uncharacterized protein (DUF983 family)
MFKGIRVEVVKGQCPTCHEHTALVGIEDNLFRCLECGTDLEQKVNGKISYIPVLTTTPDTAGKFYLHDWDDDK